MIKSVPPIRRMQIIWTCLRSGRLFNAAEMARQLEVSTKAIHRDLEYMRWTLGFKIQYDGSLFAYRLAETGECPFCKCREEELGFYYFPRRLTDDCLVPNHSFSNLRGLSYEI
jgi:predicted DNA-binding transcriptional regulator YafY